MCPENSLSDWAEAQENDPTTPHQGNTQSPKCVHNGNSEKGVTFQDNNADADSTTEYTEKSRRKSLGRRVSFATTARVRLYEKEDDDAGEQNSETEEETEVKKQQVTAAQNNGKAVSAQFIPNETISRANRNSSLWKPMQSHKEEDDGAYAMAMTTCVGGILESNDAETLKNFESDPDRMELTDCVGGVLNEMNSSDSGGSNSFLMQPVATLEDTCMDLTDSVGRILSESTLPNPFSEESALEPMDMTECVGEILVQEAMTHINELQQTEIDMNITACVGSIISSSMTSEPSQEYVYPNSTTASISEIVLDEATKENQSDSSTENSESLPETFVLAQDDKKSPEISKSISTEHDMHASFEVIVDEEVSFTISGPFTSPSDRQVNGQAPYNDILSPVMVNSALEYNQNISPLSGRGAVWRASLSPKAIEPTNSESRLSVSDSKSKDHLPMPHTRTSMSSTNNRASIGGTPKWTSYTTPISASIAQLSGGRSKLRGSLSARHTPVLSSGTAPTERSIASAPSSRHPSSGYTISDDHVSFIHTMEQPGIFDMISSPLSSRNVLLSPKSFQPTLHGASFSPLSQSLQRTPSKLRPLSLQEEHSALLFPSPIKVSKTPKPSKSPQAQLSPKNQMSLKEFLSTTGVRFLDHVSTSTRRETLARLYEERTSDYGFFTRDRLLLGICIHQPECQLYEQGCAVLEEKILETHSALESMETRFPTSFSIPSITKPAGSNKAAPNSFSAEFITRIKTLKNHARNQAQDQWYQWRRTHLLPLDSLFQEHINHLDQDGLRLDQLRSSLVALSTQMNAFKAQLLDRRKEIERNQILIKSMDWSKYKKALQQKSEEEDRIRELNERLNSLSRQSAQYRTQMDLLSKEKDGLLDSLGLVHQDLDSLIEIDMGQVSLTKVYYDLICQTAGVRIKKIHMNSISSADENPLLEFICAPIPELFRLHLFISPPSDKPTGSLFSIQSVKCLPPLSQSTQSLPLQDHTLDSICIRFCLNILPKLLQNIPFQSFFTRLFEEIYLAYNLQQNLEAASLQIPIELLPTDSNLTHDRPQDVDGLIVAQFSIPLLNHGVYLSILRPHSKTIYFHYSLVVTHLNSPDQHVKYHSSVHLSELLDQILKLQNLNFVEDAPIQSITSINDQNQ
jgi:hypothetical protein